jgi:hypothetical protein
VVFWGVAAALVVATLLIAMSPSWSGATTGEQVIDTAAPVNSTSCAPCHLDLGDVSVPGLIFGHGNHLLISCDGCHSRMPHRGGNDVERVPMEVCFACHGINHGDQGELATSECRDCHTPSFELRPGSHGTAWKGEPHAKAVDASGVNGCMMCHRDPAQCNDCHAAEAPEVRQFEAVYHSIVTPRPKGPSVLIQPKGPVSMSQCIYCHKDVDDILPGRLIFAHADHIVRNYPCQVCHERFPHTEVGLDRPDMMSCYRCHGLNHNSHGQVATDKCDACHPKEFDLMPGDHTKRFILGTHKERANSDPAYCAMCHASSFCVGCHRGQKVSPNAPGRPVIPADHRKATWMKRHGPLFLDGEGACGSCHDDRSCKRCHKTVMPHPIDWVENHKPPAGIGRDDCAVCHKDRNSCQECHHSKVKRSQLTRENCTPCHDEMKQTPATSIKHKGFAEHAVHFDVAELKGKPYGCYECHVDFGSSANADKLELQQGHDLRLCYDCHGALDPFNRLIAKYKGAALCRKCHYDIGI